MRLLKNNKLKKSKTSKTKPKKCQSFARGRQDLIKTWPVPDTGLTRPNKKMYKRSKQKSKYITNVTLAENNKPTKSFCSQKTKNKMCLCKNCQERQDLIKTWPFHSKGQVLYSTKNISSLLNVKKVSILSHKVYFLSRKRRNKLIKQVNGNGKKVMNICHWNLGIQKLD